MKIVMDKPQYSAVIHSVAELELVRAKSTIEQFIYSCSHTMRGPLKSITGLVYLLKNAERIAEVNPKDYLLYIENTVAKLESVLNDLEQFLTNSRQDIATRSIDVNEFVGSVLQEFEDTIKQKKINTVITIKQSAKLYTDQNCLRIILSHLISNAITYQDLKKEQRQITITVKIDLSSCCMKIRDNGIGMSEEIRSNIFDLFYRGSAKSPGAGVGLYITKEVLNKMGGVISVRSKAGKGTCSHFSIPNLSV
jgi:signal transduction histidine kinase